VKGEGRRGRGRRVARAEEGALPQDSCSLGTVAPFQWRGVEASQKQEQKGVCLLRLLAFLETHVEGICWECSILGLGLVFLDAPLRRKSWGRGGDVREARYALRPQRPKPQSPLTSHPSPCQPLDSFPPSPDPPTGVSSCTAHPGSTLSCLSSRAWQNHSPQHLLCASHDA